MTLTETVSKLLWTATQNVVRRKCAENRYDGYDELIADIESKIRSNLLRPGTPRTDYRFTMLIVLTRTLNASIGTDKDEMIGPEDLGKLIGTEIRALDDDGVIGSVGVTKAMITIDVSLDHLVHRSLTDARAFADRTFMDRFRVDYGNDADDDGDDDDGITGPQVLIDFSSPNVAKDMHVGHLRSTIIGDTLFRLLRVFYGEDRIVCQNHIGDWGTQFGMIINYLRQEHGDIDQIMKYLNSIESDRLLPIYRSAKELFDNKDGATPMFADESRHQTYCLQQGSASADPADVRTNTENMMIWHKICEMSAVLYRGVYRKLMITDRLIDRGESFYNEYIPGVLSQIEGMMYDEGGAKLIKFDDWDFPLIVVKKDGGYTYATTDITAIWHRSQIVVASKMVYITDSGQAPHFAKVFDVAVKAGWIEREQAVHIGLGLVTGPDGKKLKTRSGDVIKLDDVIDEITTISNDVISDRAAQAAAGEDVHSGYMDIGRDDIVKMSEVIGMNTLKYYDDAHLYSSSWRYDPKKMFEFKGDTGVYQMYCYCRIGSIIDKSQYVAEQLGQYVDDLEIDDVDGKAEVGMDNGADNGGDEKAKIATIKDDPNFADLTDIDRALLSHLVRFDEAMCEAHQRYEIKPIMDYTKELTLRFNRFVSKQNVKILGASTEKYRFVICVLSHRILGEIFEILGFGKIDFI